jgi:putative DNA primase/helicase
MASLCIVLRAMIQFVCLDYVRTRLGLPVFAPGSHARMQRETAATVVEHLASDTNRNADYARTIWRESGSIKGTIAEDYLASRRLRLDHSEDWHHVLRFHTACPFGPDRAPAVIALMKNVITDEARCIQRTRLMLDGHKISRQMLGPAKGAAIKIDADADITMGLCIGEGLETCLAARQIGFRPVWALGSTGGIANFPALPGIEAITILAETGDASAKAIDQCGLRWHDVGREIIIASPNVGADINDAIREAR